MYFKLKTPLRMHYFTYDIVSSHIWPVAPDLDSAAQVPSHKRFLLVKNFTDLAKQMWALKYS